MRHQLYGLLKDKIEKVFGSITNVFLYYHILQESLSQKFNAYNYVNGSVFCDKIKQLLARVAYSQKRLKGGDANGKICN
jgi:hypothetical protein